MIARRRLLVAVAAMVAAPLVRIGSAFAGEASPGRLVIDPDALVNASDAPSHLLLSRRRRIDTFLLAAPKGRRVTALLAPANYVILMVLLRGSTVQDLQERGPRREDLAAFGLSELQVRNTASVVEFVLAPLGTEH